MLTVYVDRGPRSELAIQHLIKFGISFEVKEVHKDKAAAAFLLNQLRPPSHFPLPQFYIGTKLVWENGYKDMANLTAEQINQLIEEINATNT